MFDTLPDSVRRSLWGLLVTVLAACAGAPPPLEPHSEPPPVPESLRLFTGAPEGGLPWRLYLSREASARQPHGLLIWMHPSGGSAHPWIEPLAPELARRGWALLLVEKDFTSWRGVEANQLMLVTVPDVARGPGVETRRPVLLGFSAGAQMALELWAARPESFGGLVLLAGAPRFSRGSEREPPHGKAHGGVPLLALVGERDGSAPLWREAQVSWRAAGIPLETLEVPERGHEWLLMGEPLTRVLTWLEGLAMQRRGSASVSPR